MKLLNFLLRKTFYLSMDPGKNRKEKRNAAKLVKERERKRKGRKK